MIHRIRPKHSVKKQEARVGYSYCSTSECHMQSFAGIEAQLVKSVMQLDADAPLMEQLGLQEKALLMQETEAWPLMGWGL